MENPLQFSTICIHIQASFSGLVKASFFVIVAGGRKQLIGEESGEVGSVGLFFKVVDVDVG